jgi:hypothetical protein
MACWHRGRANPWSSFAQSNLISDQDLPSGEQKDATDSLVPAGYWVFSPEKSKNVLGPVFGKGQWSKSNGEHAKEWASIRKIAPPHSLTDADLLAN